jgi:hypothetical protein
VFRAGVVTRRVRAPPRFAVALEEQGVDFLQTTDAGVAASLGIDALPGAPPAVPRTRARTRALAAPPPQHRALHCPALLLALFSSLF